MARGPGTCKRSRVAQLLIRFRRPAAMSDSEMRAHILRRARGRRSVLGRARVPGSDDETLVLGVGGAIDANEAADEQLFDLLIEGDHRRAPPPGYPAL